MNLKKQAFSGVKWTALSTITLTIVQLVQLVILARLLNPEDFGLIALVMVVIGFSQLFIDMGVSNAIIYKQQASENDLSTLYWLNILLGLCFYILLFFITPYIAQFYENQKLTPLINLVSLTFLVRPLGQQFMVLLQKELKFEIISKIEIISRLIAFAIVIYSAVIGYGVYSLAFGSIIYAVCTTVGYIFFGRKLYRPRFYFKISEVREFINFGLFQMGDKFLNYIASQMDTILIGKLLGVEILGVYNIAKQLTSKPYGIINPVITKVTFPIMAKIGDNIIKLKTLFIKLMSYISYLNISIYFLIMILAEPIVMLVFGVKWKDAIPLVQILSMAYLFRSFGNPAGSLLLSRGKAKLAFYWNLLVFILYPLFIFTGSFWGIQGVSIAALFLQLTLFLPNWKINVYSQTKIKLKEYLLVFRNPFIFSFISLLVAFPMVLLFENYILRIILSCLTFVIIFIGLLYRFERAITNDFLDFLPIKISGKLK